MNVAFEEANKHQLKIISLNFTDKDLFETKANNEILRWFMSESENDVIALFQDDILLRDSNLKEKIETIINNVPNLGLIGGRSGYELNSLKFPEQPVKKVSNWEHLQSQYGFDLQEELMLYMKRTFLNRGPIVFTRKLINKVGYLDEKYYPQWGDDLDYCARCKFEHGLDNVVFACNVESKLEWGTTHKHHNPFLKHAIKPNWNRFIAKWGKYII